MQVLKTLVKKKFYLILLNLIFVNLIYSQVTRVTYKNNIYGGNINLTKLSEEKKAGLTNRQIELLEERLKNEADIEFELLYTKDVSLYQKVEKLSILENTDLNKLLDNNKYYKNLNTLLKLYQIEKPEFYNIIVPFDQYKWDITTETKMIDGYKCYKATTTYEDIYNPYKNRKSIFNPVVWFTPDIPISFGPRGLDGLPGLVLEASVNGKKYLYASKIEFNYKKNIEIEKPKGGKDISKEDLEKIILENFKKRQ